MSGERETERETQTLRDRHNRTQQQRDTEERQRGARHRETKTKKNTHTEDREVEAGRRQRLNRDEEIYTGIKTYRD